MQHVSGFGLPTPPASPVYDNLKYPYHQPVASPQHCPVRCVPLAPEERLGRFLEGKLQLTSILGTGAYGVVYSAVDAKTGMRYAVKCLSKFNPDGTPLDRRQVAFQNREIRLHHLASTHQNVVSMLKIVDHPDCIYVILEYCPEGDLFYNITERGQYVGKDHLAKKVFLQIVDAVEHCHSLGIYHRDLKPENVLVTDQGETVKLADFGLATASDRSEDYGCGSTFYMSPECLDQSTRRPFYFCAPNDVWSLGVILVNLTCGRNPWKQASFEDSTYRAFTRSKEFLKTILPVSDDLNDILARIFTRDPDQRISLADLRSRIMACASFTIPAPASAVVPTTTASPQPIFEYVQPCDEMSIDHTAALSPTSSGSDEGSVFSDDDGSLTSSGSTIDDLDEDFLQEQQQAMAPQECLSPQHFDLEEQSHVPFYPTQEFVPQHYTGPVPSPVAHPHQVPYDMQGFMPMPQHNNAHFEAQKSYIPYIWDHMVKYVQQQAPAYPQAHGLFHPQVPLFVVQPGCY